MFHLREIHKKGRNRCPDVVPQEPESQNTQGIAERLLASFGSMVVYWHHWHASRTRINFNTVPTDTVASVRRLRAR